MGIFIIYNHYKVFLSFCFRPSLSRFKFVEYIRNFKMEHSCKIVEKGPKHFEIAEDEIIFPVAMANKLRYGKNIFHVSNEEEK